MLAYMQKGALYRCPTSGGNAQSTAAPLFSQAFVCVAGLKGWRTLEETEFTGHRAKKRKIFRKLAYCRN